MSQAGKILQLYVEVRSVPEVEGHRVGDMEVMNPVVLQGTDILPQHRCSSSPSTPQTVQRGFSSSHSIAPSRSPSRHSVSFQLHPSGDHIGPSSFHRQSLQYDNIDQLRSPVQPGTNSANSLLCAHSSESDCFLVRSPPSPTSSGRATSPYTPHWGCRSYEVPEVDDGRRSIVTFSYIEKASIKSVKSPQGSKCQSGTDTPTNPFNRPLEERPVPSHSQKRLSDPMWPDSRASFCTSGQKLPNLPSGDQQVPSPNIRGAILDSIARAATHRALEEFGSQELRRKVAGMADSPQCDQQPQSQSWSGSPVPERVASMLPSNFLMDQEMCRSGCALPRSPASDSLSIHARQETISMSTSSSDRSQGSTTHHQCMGSDIPRPISKPGQVPQNKSSIHNPNSSPHSVHRVNFNRANSPSKQVDGMNQLSGKKNVSPVNSPEMARHLAEEATKLSTIFMEARRSSSPTLLVDMDSPRKGCKLWETQHCSSSESQGSPAQHLVGMNIPLHDCPRTGSGSLKTGHTSGKDALHLQTPDMESPVLLRRAEKDSNNTQPPSLHYLRSPALPSRLHKTGIHSKDINQSPIRDPRKQKVEHLPGHSPTLHRYQPPQYTGDGRSPVLDRRHNPKYDQVRDSPDATRKISLGQYIGVPSGEASVSCQQHCVEIFPVKDMPKAGHHGERHVSPSQLSKRSRESEPQRRETDCDDPMEAKCLEGTLITSREQSGCSIQEKFHDDRHQSGQPGSSQSSSGITGSVGDGHQQDGNCISPESSQSSQKSSDTGRGVSAIQPDSSSSPLGPSLHSQKIARAKWEFLFGTSSEDGVTPTRKDVPDASTAPPSGTSSESPTPIPPNSLPVKPAPIQRARGEAGQRVASHSVHHVEVELVTPPAAVAGALPKTGIIRRTLKYSETDLDAVPLRCYRETDIDEVLAEQEESDSAFGSSPLGGAPYARTDGEEEEEEEELEEEEEVVSWASVRMQGDKKRQNATQEEDEVFSPLLKRPLESESNGPLKSPIAVTSPRRISEDGLDSFSRHFESIMESHRAKGTSYSSLDSVELLSSSQAVFTFDLPTLTPEIQSQICESARHISELGFAPLAQSEQPSRSDSTHITSDSETVTAPLPGDEVDCGDTDRPSGSFSKQSLCEHSQPCPRERPGWLASDFHLEPELRDRLGLGSTDALINGSKADLEAARRLAKRLYNLDGFKKSDVARHLSKNNEFSQMVAEEYLRYFNFTGLTVDQALRAFLKEFALMGETQERERVLSHFSRRYLQCNPKAALSEDGVHTLTCALMLLNTDLHGHNIGKRMSCLQFIGNLEGLNDGQDFSKDLLKSLYNSIKSEKLQWTIDEEELRKSFSELADGRTDSASHTMKRISSGGNPFAAVTQQPGALVYKNGFLVRKVHADSDGKKTPRGKRGWKAFYAILKGLILYLQKGEYRPEKQLSDEDLKNAVSIHHSLAMRAADYSKRPNVFYLRTADWRVFLFQAPNAEQMQSWITRINTVAAMFSAPPFPAAIGSQKRFSRPLLPGSTTKLSQEEQVQSHEARFRATSSELSELRSCPPDRKVKGRELEEYRQREEYLEFEKTRYGTYAMLLRTKIQSGEDDLSTFESRLYEDNGLQRAHSSPMLQQEGSQGGQGSKAKQANSSCRVASSSSKGSRRGDSQRASQRQAVKQ